MSLHFRLELDIYKNMWLLLCKRDERTFPDNRLKHCFNNEALPIMPFWMLQVHVQGA